MRYLVIYNIADDNLRVLLAESLKDYGLQQEESRELRCGTRYECSPLRAKKPQTITDHAHAKEES